MIKIIKIRINLKEKEVAINCLRKKKFRKKVEAKVKLKVLV